MVTIIPKPPKKIPQWQLIFLYLSFALLAIAIILYFVLNYFQDKASVHLQDLEKKIGEISTAENKAIESDVSIWQNKIKDFSLLFGKHKKSSQFFEFLEEITHPKIWFTSLDLDTSLSQVKLEGTALDFQTLAQQLYILDEENLIKTTKLINIALEEEGEISFSLEFSISPEVLNHE